MTTVSGVRTPAPSVLDPHGRRTRWGWLLAALWLVYLGDPLAAAWRHPAGPVRIAGVVAVFAFAAAYVGFFVVNRGARHRGERLSLGRSWACVLGLVVLVAAMAPAAGPSCLTALIFVTAAAVFALPTPMALGVVVVLIVTAELVPRVVPGWEGQGIDGFSLALTALAIWGIAQLIERTWQLARAQQQIARLAVVEERSRLGRDLHDILGHSLTVITVKAELAGRLLDKDPARAGAQIADLERLSRDALADVRATASGYRSVTLSAELASARSALSAAGISAELPTAIDEIPGERRELFGWAVREGVTNVIRHSGARTCRIRVRAEGVEVTDDGRGPGGGTGGHGLSGLRERVAHSGGAMTVGRASDGGFALSVRVPDAP